VDPVDVGTVEIVAFNWNGLLGHRTEAEYVSRFCTIFLINIIDYSRV
jgi:hypothetical protein